MCKKVFVFSDIIFVQWKDVKTHTHSLRHTKQMQSVCWSVSSTNTFIVIINEKKNLLVDFELITTKMKMKMFVKKFIKNSFLKRKTWLTKSK